MVNNSTNDNLKNNHLNLKPMDIYKKKKHNK
jgi:hypothetical protein